MAGKQIENPASAVAQGMRRAGWLKTLLQWHWISSALCLVCIVLFSLTGITLNHAGQIESKPTVHSRKAQAPAPVQAELRRFGAGRDGVKAPLTPLAARWAAATWSIGSAAQDAEWSADDVYLALPRPGGDAWLRIALADGAAEYEVTDRGWVSWLNDLHKGRNAGPAWGWFIDLLAVACLVFAVTGFLILKMHAHNRPFTWPMVGLGLVLPAVLALLFVH